MTGDWRDHEAGRTGLSVAGLDDGESVTCQVIDEPFRRETATSEDALHVPVRIVGDIPDGFDDMSGDSVADETEYNVINSSTAFFEALLEAFPNGEISGQMMSVEAHQPEDQYSRSYSISPE